MTRVERTLLGTQLLNGLGFGLVFPVAAFTAEGLGADAAAITLILAVHPLVRLLSGPAWGAAADRWGRRPVMLVGIVLAGLGHLVFGLAGSLGALVVARAATGLGAGDAVAAAAIVADTSDGAARTAAIGRLRASYGLGMLAGPVVGGLCALAGLAWPPRVAAMACAVNLVVAWFTLEETRGRRTVGAATDRRGVRALLAMPGVVYSLWIAFAATLALTLAESVVSLAVEHVFVPRQAWARGLPPVDVAVGLTVALIMAWGLTQAVVEGGVAGALAARIGERRVVVAGLAAWAVGFALTPVAYVHGLVAGGIAVIGTAAAVGFTSTANSSLYSSSIPEDQQGTGFGLYQAASAAGDALGPAVAGALFARWFGLPYLVGALVLVTAWVAALGLADRRSEAQTGSRLRPRPGTPSPPASP